MRNINSTSLEAQTVKNLPEMQETQVQSVGQENPLEKRMATHSSILAWRISWTEEPNGLQSMGSQRIGHSSITVFWGLSEASCRGFITVPGSFCTLGKC